MQDKIIKRSIEEQIIATQARLQQLHRNKQKKINKTLINTFSFFNSENEILKMLLDRATDKEFSDKLRVYLLDFEDFKGIARGSKLEDELNIAFSNYKTGETSGD